MSVDDCNAFNIYLDLWKTTRERNNAHSQGIDTSLNNNTTRLRINTNNAAQLSGDSAIAEAFGNRFHTPLDFELLESHMPFYQSALGDRLEYELVFNDYS